MKKKLLISIILFSMGYLMFKYTRFIKIKTMYLSEMITIQSFQLKHYYRIHLRLPKTKQEYDSYMQHTKDLYLYNFMNKIEYGFSYDSAKKEFYVYGYGFDNIDNKCKFFYDINNISYISSLFIKGDVLLSKVNISKVKSFKNIENTHFYSSNSIVELPELEMDSFINVINKFKANYANTNLGIDRGVLLKPGVTHRFMIIGKMIKEDEYVFSINNDFTDSVNLNFLSKEVSKLKLFEKHKIITIYLPINLALKSSDFYER